MLTVVRNQSIYLDKLFDYGYRYRRSTNNVLVLIIIVGMLYSPQRCCAVHTQEPKVLTPCDAPLIGTGTVE